MVAGMYQSSSTSGNMEDELSISRKCTEEHPITETVISTTPERDIEMKRRRLTSESQVPLPFRGHLDSCSPGASDASDQTSLAEAERYVLRSHLVNWSHSLLKLQPKVHMSDHLIESGLCLFRYLRRLQIIASAEGRFPQDYLGNDNLLIHDLIACWWIAMKHCSVRTKVPNRTLMSRATGARPDLLADRELAALVGIDWDVNAVLRANGLAS